MRARRREERLTGNNENNQRGQKDAQAAGAASQRCNQQHGALPAQPGTTTTQRGAASSPAAQRVRVDAEQPLDAQAARAVRERSGTRKKRRARQTQSAARRHHQLTPSPPGEPAVATTKNAKRRLPKHAHAA